MKFSGNRAFVLSLPQASTCTFTLSEFQTNLTGVALKVRQDQLTVGFPVLSGALKTPPRAEKLQNQRAGREPTSRSESTLKKKV